MQKILSVGWGPDVTFFSHQRMAQRAVRTSLVSAVGSSKARHCRMRENTTPVFARDQIDFPRHHNKWCILLITFLGLNIFYSWYMYNSLKQYANHRNGSHVASVRNIMSCPASQEWQWPHVLFTKSSELNDCKQNTTSLSRLVGTTVRGEQTL